MRSSLLAIALLLPAVTNATVVDVIGEIHRGINNGSEPAEIIVFYAGVVATPLTIEAE